MQCQGWSHSLTPLPSAEPWSLWVRGCVGDRRGRCAGRAVPPAPGRWRWRSAARGRAGELREGRELGIIACKPRVQLRSTRFYFVWAEVEPYFMNSLTVRYFYCAVSFFFKISIILLCSPSKGLLREQHSTINISYVSANEAYFVRVDQDVSA